MDEQKSSEDMGVRWTHRTCSMDEVYQGEAEVKVVLKKDQIDSAKPTPVCEDQQEKTDDQKWARLPRRRKT
jgi:hypothetical protein